MAQDSLATAPAEMFAARLHGPRDLRVDRVPHPGPPPAGHALLRVLVTGICGSDLHSYQDFRIGDTPVQAPLVLGHEFAAVVEQVSPEGEDGNFEPLRAGVRVAVDPAQPCGRCELCAQGHPNLCRRLHFCGNYPDGGSLCEWMHMPSRCCFPVPTQLTDVEAALLEPLGVALHAMDLARLRIGDSMAIFGAGPIGLLLVQLARLAGADPVFVTDPLAWRLQAAARYGAVPVGFSGNATADEIRRASPRQLGVDVGIEAAWGDESVAQTAEAVRLGGRLVLVGIPSDDRLQLKHSTARRKGLTIRLSRRMKHIYPRATALALARKIDLEGMVSDRVSLSDGPAAFERNARYADGVVKIMVQSNAR